MKKKKMCHISRKEAWNLSLNHFRELIKEGSGARIENEAAHAKKVLEWGLYIEFRASYRLKICWNNHDIERLLKDKVMREKDEPYDKYKRRHQIKSAEHMRNFLTQVEAHPDLINDVYRMILYHDVGDLAAAESDVTTESPLYKDYRLLKDADSITFMDIHLNEYIKREGLENAKSKLHFSYNKLTQKAKNRPKVQRLYIDCKEKLNNLEKKLAKE